jgi:hypothetical protein
MNPWIYSLESGGQEQKVSLAGSSHFKKYMILFVPITNEDIHHDSS